MLDASKRLNLHDEAVANSCALAASNKFSRLADQLSLAEGKWTLFWILIAEIGGEQLGFKEYEEETLD